MSKAPKSRAWLSIDFEDFSHDLKRWLGVARDGPMREEALHRAYAAIEGFCRGELGGARLTFFCTGILAQKCPDVVQRIAADGHEVACHYHFHDRAYDDPPERFQANLELAIAALEAASGQKVLGFRAPQFTVRPQDHAHYRVLAKLFAYDSTLTVADAAEVEAFRKAAGLEGLALFPVARRKVLPGLPALRSGGTFLKLFPLAATMKVLADGERAGIPPMVYVHPYEFVHDGSFHVPMRELAGLGRRDRLYWSLRQAQWHRLRNRSVMPKLARIFRRWEIGGPLRDLLG
jgi:hypothetical protein